MFKKTFHIDKRSFYPIVLAGILSLVMILSGTPSYATPKSVKQKGFASPEKAVKALIKAIKAKDNKALSRILGPESKEIISSGDEVADKVGRDKFIKAYEEQNKLEKETPEKLVLHVGKNGWPMPIPVVKKGNAWFFDTNAGKEELLNRRIGRNELNVIEVLHAYVDAQREYACRDRDADGRLEFSQRFISTEGKHDGLYWEAKEGDKVSPLGPLVARAAVEGYIEDKTIGGPTPFHGYCYKILKGQGAHATGGAYDYVVNGNMILGFALLAYPAQYGNSGVMTFMVNQEGIVYEKDLGKNTEKIAPKIEAFDADESWKRAEAAKQVSQPGRP